MIMINHRVLAHSRPGPPPVREVIGAPDWGQHGSYARDDENTGWIDPANDRK